MAVYLLGYTTYILFQLILSCIFIYVRHDSRFLKSTLHEQGMCWIELAQERAELWDFVNTIMNIWIHRDNGICDQLCQHVLLKELCSWKIIVK
jgi:hypothetical protein